MSDLIDRQAAIDALNKKKIYRPLDSDRWVISDCLNEIVKLPPAQPKRMRGRWEVNPIYIKCSECGESFMLIPQNYCPNCGADMREQSHDD